MGGQKTYYPPKTNFDYLKNKDGDYLKDKDELTGIKAFVSDKDLKGNMLKFINSVQSNYFKESTLSFPPTYKLDRKGNEKSCAKKIPATGATARCHGQIGSSTPQEQS